METSFRTGLESLLREDAHLLKGRRVGLVSHAAAVAGDGSPSALRLRLTRGVTLAALFGPEHGYDGQAGAGVRCPGSMHRAWNIPVFSLYGQQRKPTPRMLRGIDTLVFDMQDLGVRCYTYVSTLRFMLEAASEAGKPVIVADRPIPLPCVADGPLPDDGCASFVAAIPAPLSYGMTPGETALWLRERLGLALDLHVARMRGYRRQPGWDSDWPPWMPPSPGIVSWESARCYPATVLAEGLPSIDHGRGTPLPFRVFAARWLRADATVEFLAALRLPGVAFHQHPYRPAGRRRVWPGVRLTITDPAGFLPVRTAVSLVYALQRLHGKDRVWSAPKERAAFFDTLMGTPSVRQALLDGESPAAIAARWRKPLASFCRARAKCLLYRPR